MPHFTHPDSSLTALARTGKLAATSFIVTRTPT